MHLWEHSEQEMHCILFEEGQRQKEGIPPHTGEYTSCTIILKVPVVRASAQTGM
jgi:hypothetical protein